jgi:serine/threonine protein kinase
MKAAENMKGLDLDGGWHVDERVERTPKGTGGYSSISYIVSKKDGEKAFLKSLDFSSAMQEEDLTRKLYELTSTYEYERNLLRQCKDKRLRHVVVPLADGTVKVPGNFGELDRVPYLIFPMANGDIRAEVERWKKFEKKFDLAWALRSLHHSAIGLQELHAIGIAHQDIKPSNVLVFPIEGSKLTDLGSASQVGNPSRSDKKMVPGDVSYAVPEQWYSWSQSQDFAERYLVDLYRLGSLIFFFFADCSATDALQLKLSIKFGKEFTRSDFISDLPYMQHAFEETLNDLREMVKELAGDLTDEIIIIAQQLCDPDPRRRGDPVARAATFRRQHDIQAYISRFDRLASTAELKMI